MENTQGKTLKQSDFVLKSPKIIVHKGQKCHNYICVSQMRLDCI